jgi:lactoylglutathione lyase
MAVSEIGDRIIAADRYPLILACGRLEASPSDGRHFGLVVDDKEAARSALRAAGVGALDGQFLDFRDPWGNRIEIVGYDNIQFTKAPNVLRGIAKDSRDRRAEKALTAQ